MNLIKRPRRDHQEYREHSTSVEGTRARFNWTYIKGRQGEFPELYILRSEMGDRIKVEVARPRRLVRISADTRLGNHIQSTISSGSILRERDLNTGKYLNLEEYFNDLSLELSSLPDTQVLRMIGGNYGVFTEFLGKIESRAFKPQDSGNLPLLMEFLGRLPRRIISTIRNWLRSLLGWPTMWDLVDVSLVTGLSYSMFQWNFNFLMTGIWTCMGALLSGCLDWSWRDRSPYILKVLVLMVPGMAAMYFGFIYQ